MMNRNEEEKEANSERWALTYSDMITLLLVLFILMYTMSTVDAEKYKELSTELSKTFTATNDGGKGPGLGSGDGFGIGTDSSTSSVAPNKDNSSSSIDSSSTQADGGTDIKQPVTNFDEIYEVLKKNVESMGYGDEILLEKNSNAIHFRFKDSILFYPDSIKMRDRGKSVLQYVSKTLLSVDYLYSSVRIEGYTADIGVKGQSNLSSWKLSTDRALTVLEYMVFENGLVEEKMSIAGFSHYNPIGDNKTEAGKAKNRRVEITVTSIEVPADKISPNS
ncbi:MAG: flagellar motor protein MotB [Oscillospiraceae bacterium]